jgi:hypothetical protein
VRSLFALRSAALLFAFATSSTAAQAPTPAPKADVPITQDSAKRPAKSKGSGKKKGKSTKAATAAAPARPEPKWPVEGPAPLPGSILPGKRIVTFYGNPLSDRMGILGRLPAKKMMDSLEAQAKAWEAADPSTPVVRALELVTVVGAGDAGTSGLWRTRMRDTMINGVIAMAKSRGWHTILDVQIGQGTYKAEVEHLLPFLKDPTVHLGLDPEFDMPPGKKPGSVIGTSDAAEINGVIKTLAELVDKEKLPPKVLLIHRFTKPMLTHASKIILDPRVQVSIVMDGFGSPTLKKGSYDHWIYREPVQFTGFKVFYFHRRVRDNPIMTPSEVLALKPKPLVIIYQ